MLVFIDESWQEDQKRGERVGVLSAVMIPSALFNNFSQTVYQTKVSHLGHKAASLELKGRGVLGSYQFKLESSGVRSSQLALVRELLGLMGTLEVQVFASIVFSKQELALACTDANHLERPFFFLFERIALCMKERHPGLIAKVVFDDRGYETNQRISAAVSNFFHKSQAGQSFDTILKVPFFAISKENAGIQMADIVAYILGGKCTNSLRLSEFFLMTKKLEFKSQSMRDVEGKKLPWLGFKFIKEKEAGGFLAQGATKPMRRPESPPPTSTM